MREILDILGRKIEVGDVVLRPMASRMTRVYILGISTKGVYISRKKTVGSRTINWNTGEKGEFIYTESHAELSEHNDKQYLSYPPDLYILEKNAVIPENLKQFIKY